MSEHTAIWRTAVVRGHGQDSTHLAIIDVNHPAFSFDDITLDEWLELQHWPSTSCGVPFIRGRAPCALCGHRLPGQDYATLEAPDTPVSCAGCQGNARPYPMLTPSREGV
jgi:hypothetical protein